MNGRNISMINLVEYLKDSTFFFVLLNTPSLYKVGNEISLYNNVVSHLLFQIYIFFKLIGFHY